MNSKQICLSNNLKEGTRPGAWREVSINKNICTGMYVEYVHFFSKVVSVEECLKHYDHSDIWNILANRMGLKSKGKTTTLDRGIPLKTYCKTYYQGKERA